MNAALPRMVPCLFALTACTPDVCAEMCVAAQDRFEACLEEGGLSWGASVGYDSPSDYENGCETFAWELRELGQAETCGARLETFEDGTCSDYHDAWGVE